MTDADEFRKPAPIDAAAAAKSLRFLLGSPSLGDATATQTPALHLMRRLEQPDAVRWLDGCLARPPFAPLADAGRVLLGGSATLEELRALKDRAKAGFAPSHPLDFRMASIAAYFFAIAAALKCHGASITSQPLPELRTILIDLAAVVVEPWSSFLSSAAFVEPEH